MAAQHGGDCQREDSGSSASCSCSGHGLPPPLQQSMEEMDFDRSLAGSAQKGDLIQMRKLLDRGQCVDGSAGTSNISGRGHTPLHYAARSGKLEACKLLLESGARVDVRTSAGGATPLHSAACGGHAEVILLLLERGADPLLQDADGETALHKAYALGRGRVAALLEEACPSAAAALDARGRTPRTCAR